MSLITLITLQGIVNKDGVGCVKKLYTEYFLRFYLFIFRERGRKGERERNINVWLPLKHPLLGTWPATWASALTGNQIRDPSQASIQSTKPYQTGPYIIFKYLLVKQLQ